MRWLVRINKKTFLEYSTVCDAPVCLFEGDDYGDVSECMIDNGWDIEHIRTAKETGCWAGRGYTKKDILRSCWISGGTRHHTSWRDVVMDYFPQCVARVYIGLTS
jgi:hypothetical protein